MFRILFFALCVWWVCGYFYRLGRKSALNGREKKTRVKRPGSKVVESSVVENPEDDAQTKE